nr:extensin-like [Aegilops tauschii subsp. strangulata]
MSSAAPPAAAAAAPISTATAPALAPMSPFLASRPLAATYGALPPPPASPHASGASDDLIAPPEPAALPAYGGPPPPNPNPGAGPPTYDAPAPSYGAPPPSSSLWPVPAYAVPPPSQPYTRWRRRNTTTTRRRHRRPMGARPPRRMAPLQRPATALWLPPPGSYSSPGAYGSYSAMIPHPEAAPSMDPYAPLQAYTAQAAAPSPFYVSHLLPVKIAPDNYLSWRAQVLPLLRSRYLEGYVDGSIPCPPPQHPAYHTWVA